MRTGQRIESALRLLLAVVVVAAVPMCIGAGMMTCAAIEHRIDRVRAEAQSVDATLDRVPEANTFSGHATVAAPVHWSYSGQAHSGTVQVSTSARVGDHVPVTVQPNGDQLPTLPTYSMAAANGIGVAAGIFALAVLLAAGANCVLDRVLARRQDRDWTVEWSALAQTPRWNSL